MNFNLIVLVIFALFIVVAIGKAFYDIHKGEEKNNDYLQKLSDTPNFRPNFVLRGIGNRYLLAVDRKSQRMLYLDPKSKKEIPFKAIEGVEMIESDANESFLDKQIEKCETIENFRNRFGQYQRGSKIQVVIKIKGQPEPSLIIDCYDARSMSTTGTRSVKLIGLDESIYKEGKEKAQKINDVVKEILDIVKNGDPGETEEIQLVENPQKQSPSFQDLAKLMTLRNEGALTEDEYERMTKSLLTRVKANNTTRWETRQEIQDNLNNGNILMAIKLYKDYTGCSMEEAREYIEKHR